MNQDQKTASAFRRAAMQKGYKFIKLRLKDSYPHITDSPVKVHGVFELIGELRGGQGNRKEYNFYIRRDASLKFEYIEDFDDWVAYMYVDDLEHASGRKGCNLEMLAAHHNNNPIFEIVEKEIDKGLFSEVRKRQKLIQKQIAEEKAEKAKAAAAAKIKQDHKDLDEVDLELQALEEAKEQLLLKRQAKKDRLPPKRGNPNLLGKNPSLTGKDKELTTA